MQSLRSPKHPSPPLQRQPSIVAEPLPPQPTVDGLSVERLPQVSSEEPQVISMTAKSQYHSLQALANNTMQGDKTLSQTRPSSEDRQPSTPRTAEPSVLPHSSPQKSTPGTDRLLGKQAPKPVRLKPISNNRRHPGLAHQPQLVKADELTPQNLTAEETIMAEGLPNQADDSDAIPSSVSMFQPTSRPQFRSLADHSSLTHHRQPQPHSAAAVTHDWGRGQSSVPPHWSRISSAANGADASRQFTPPKGALLIPARHPSIPGLICPMPPSLVAFPRRKIVIKVGGHRRQAGLTLVRGIPGQSCRRCRLTILRMS
jgi:hypothetical protein